MNATWLWQDPVLRSLPRWLIWSLATTLLLLGLAVNLSLYSQRAHGHELGSALSATCFGLVLWLPAVVLLLSRGSRTRCSPFDLSLPLTTQQLWLRHLVATALSGVLLLLAIGGIAATVVHLMARFTETDLPMQPGGLLRLMATLSISFVLTVTLVQASMPARTRLPGSRAFSARTILFAMATFALAVLLMQLPLILLVIPGLAAWLLTRWTRPRLPAAWSLESEWAQPGAKEVLEASGQPASAVQGGSWANVPQNALPWNGLRWQVFLLRAIHSGAPKASMALWIGVPLLLGLGAVLSGAFSYMGDEELRWALLVISIYMLFALYAKPLAYLHPLDALPLSRRHLFALLTVPSLLTLIVGYGAGLLVMEWKRPLATAGIHPLRTCAGVGVPTEFHSISWNGEVEPVVAPGGESHTPFTEPLFAGLKPLVVSRFCTRDSNVSMEYQVFQAGLAAEAVYGEVPQDGAIRLFLEGNLDSLQAATPRQLAVGAKPRTPGRANIFPVIMAVVCMGAFGTLGLYLRTFRVGRLDRVRKSVFVGVLGLLLVLHTIQFILLASHLTSLWAWDVIWKVGTRSLISALPGGTPTLWILSLLVTAITYRLAERQFERAEFPISCGKGTC